MASAAHKSSIEGTSFCRHCPTMTCNKWSVIAIALSTIIALAGVLGYLGIIPGINACSGWHVPELLMGVGGFFLLFSLIQICSCKKAPTQPSRPVSSGVALGVTPCGLMKSEGGAEKSQGCGKQELAKTEAVSEELWGEDVAEWQRRCEALNRGVLSHSHDFSGQGRVEVRVKMDKSGIEVVNYSTKTHVRNLGIQTLSDRYILQAIDDASAADEAKH